MQAKEAKLLDFLRKSSQFVIPIYQRTYSWTEKECQQLWDDIIRTGSDDSISVHFVGSIVYVEQGLSQVTSQSPLLVIDGQQRLTTVTLLIASLAKVLGDEEPVSGFTLRKLRNYYLLNPEESGDRKYKLLLSQTDKLSLMAIVGGDDQPKESSLRIGDNYKFFDDLIAGCKGNLTAVCKGLAKLVVVDIVLNRDQDNPQLIFESMNSTGRELSQADLIRNYILMGLEPDLQTRLYEQYWRPMEVDFGQEAYSTQFDSFMRHYLTVKTGDIPKMGEVYEAFKAHVRSPKMAQEGVEAWVKDIRDFSRYFCAMALGVETNNNLRLAFQDLRELKVDVAYPFLLELYRDYASKILSCPDFVETVRLVEAYVFRRVICAIPTASLNKTFSTFFRKLKKDRYLESIRAHFLLLPSYRRFPSDEEFMREIQSKDLYHFRSCSYYLYRMENQGRKERTIEDDYTIEHILPQNPNLSLEWKQTLGPEWERVQKQWLHTLGNLTLSGYNSEYSDRPFTEKRDMEGGFKHSPLNLNRGLGQTDQWNEINIQKRAENLAHLALEVWTSPKLDSVILKTYKPKSGASSYTIIDDFPSLESGPMRELFDVFRKEVVALDPCISEEFLKHYKNYIAFKAETEFVQVSPRLKRLRLLLNIPSHEIDDPRGICKPTSSSIPSGNDAVKVSLSALGEIPYVMRLVRQAYERQMGNGDS